MLCCCGACGNVGQRAGVVHISTGRAGHRRSSRAARALWAVRTCWFQDRHGADLSSQVSYRHRAPHRAGHECGGSISLVVDFVHVRSAKARTQRQPVSFCVSVAALKRSSVAAAIAVRFIVPTAVPKWPGAIGNARPDGATKRATAAASSMRCVPVAIARGKRM